MATKIMDIPQAVLFHVGMSPEEQDAIDRLLDPEANTAKQKTSLKWFAEYLEESHILNLPAPKVMLQALDKFSKQRRVDATLKTRAKNLIRKYGR